MKYMKYENIWIKEVIRVYIEWVQVVKMKYAFKYIYI